MNRWKRYLIDMGPVTLLYIVSVCIAGVVSKRMDPGSLRILAAMIALPSIVWMATAEMRRLRRREELRQRVEDMTIAFSISFCVVVMLTFLDLFRDENNDSGCRTDHVDLLGCSAVPGASALSLLGLIHLFKHVA